MATARSLASKPSSVARSRRPARSRVASPSSPVGPAPPSTPALGRLRAWFQERGWLPWPFQEQTWAAYQRGHGGLVHVPTGAGKTYAAYFAPLADVIDEGREGLQILYITPLRAVSRDIELALRAPLTDLGSRVTVESRTGDTSAAVRNRQRKRWPEVLITTPESLSLLLARPEAPEVFAGLRAVIVDEWHELLASKRGTQVELALARLRGLAPSLRAWALSATIANLTQAAQAVVGNPNIPVVVRAQLDRPVFITTILPPEVDGFPWAGNLGLAMLPGVIRALEAPATTLVFTNTRSQAERWYQAILGARPQWKEELALHHGSLDRAERERVEGGLKSGSLRAVVATSSLDLGVDFAPVARVVQIGSPKGIGRLLQRAGRAAHRPGASCELLFVPTHALELFEIAAAREAIARGDIEERRPHSKPLDVLVQHLVTRALGGGFTPEELFAEVITTSAFQDLTRDEFDWALTFVRDGGRALYAYADYRRIAWDGTRYHVPDTRIARIHRTNIGTIVSDGHVQVRLVGGKNLGSVEESFVARLQAGDRFVFAGRPLEFVRLHEMVAYARVSKRPVTQTPAWRGGRQPLSPPLAAAVRRLLADIGRGQAHGVEITAAQPILAAQAALSRWPADDQLLAETCRTRDGYHLFLYPLEGRLVHEGLAALLALRLTRIQSATFSLSVNEYGLELLSPAPFPYAESLGPALFSDTNLVMDALESVNLGELAKRQFREVARVAGLIVQGPPGAGKSLRQVQTSAGLLYDVFLRYDPENLLLAQARREVLERYFEQDRLARTLARLRVAELLVVPVRRPTPLGFPLLVERLASTLSSETLLERIERLKHAWTTSA